MGDSRNSERAHNSPDRRGVNKTRKEARKLSLNEKPDGVFHGSRGSRFLQKATLTLGLLSVAAAGAEKAGVVPKQAENNFRNSRDVTVKKYEGPIIVSDVRDTQKRNAVGQVNTPDISASSDTGKDKVKSKTSKSSVTDESQITKKENESKRLSELKSVLDKLSDKGVVPKSGESEVYSKAVMRQDTFKTLFPESPADQLAAIYRSVTAVEPEVARDVNFKSMQKFLNEYGDFLEQQAAIYNLDPNILKGLILIESGGDSNAVSPAGAAGVGQQMVEMARQYGLRVDGEADERKDPKKAIPVTCKYLVHLRDTFGDMGIAVWAYHAGEGNVMAAIDVKSGGKFAGYQESLRSNNELRRRALELNARNFIKANKINAFTLLADPDVQVFLSNLEDDTARYYVKMLAAVRLLNGRELNFNNTAAKTP